MDQITANNLWDIGNYIYYSSPWNAIQTVFWIAAILLQWIHPALVALAALAWLVFDRQLPQLLFYLNAASFLPVVWYLIKPWVLVVPPHHFSLVRDMDDYAAHVKKAGIHFLLPWQQIDKRLNNGNYFCTQESVFSYKIPVYNEKINYVLGNAQIAPSVPVDSVLPYLYNQIASIQRNIVALAQYQCDNVKDAEEEVLVKEVQKQLPPYLQPVCMTVSVTNQTKPVAHSRPRRKSVGTRKK